MHNHIKRLVEATNHIKVTYSLAYDENGHPTIGIRGFFNENRMNDSIIIDDVVWLIAGEAINKVLREKVKTVGEMSFHNPETLVIDLTAQAIVYGQIVRVHLGRRAVEGVQRITDEYGVIELA